MPDKVDWDAWRSSPGMEGDHDRFLNAYKSSLKLKRKDISAFLLFSSSNEIVLVSSSMLVLETLEKLVGWLKLDSWGGEYVEKVEEALSPLIPLPDNQDCMLYEYHAVVTDGKIKGNLVTCVKGAGNGFSAIVNVNGNNGIFRVCNLMLVSFDQSIVDKRKALYKQCRPRYYKAGR